MIPLLLSTVYFLMTSAYYWNKHRSVKNTYWNQYDELTEYKKAVANANYDLGRLFTMYNDAQANVNRLKDELTSVKSDLFMARSNEK